MQQQGLGLAYASAHSKFKCASVGCPAGYDAPGPHAAADVDAAGGLDAGAWAGGTDSLMQAPMVAADDEYEDNSGSNGALNTHTAAQMGGSGVSKVCRHVLFGLQ